MTSSQSEVLDAAVESVKTPNVVEKANETREAIVVASLILATVATVAVWLSSMPS